MRKSPCCFCERKNYAGGCSIGCKDQEEYKANREAEKKKMIMASAAGSLLSDGVHKSLKEQRRRKHK